MYPTCMIESLEEEGVIHIVLGEVVEDNQEVIRGDAHTKE